MSIYVACLASYNNGILHGEWIKDLHDKTADEVHDEIQKILKSSSIKDAEEWAIHDHEFDINISEYEDIEKVVQIATLTKKYGDIFQSVYSYYNDIDNTIESFENYYRGEFDDELDFSTQLFDECNLYLIPESLQYYIDYEKFSRDMFLGGDYISFDCNGKTHIFKTH